MQKIACRPSGQAVVGIRGQSENWFSTSDYYILQTDHQNNNLNGRATDYTTLRIGPGCGAMGQEEDKVVVLYLSLTTCVSPSMRYAAGGRKLRRAQVLNLFLARHTRRESLWPDLAGGKPFTTTKKCQLHFNVI